MPRSKIIKLDEEELRRLYVSGNKSVFNFYAFKSMFEIFQGLKVRRVRIYDTELEQKEFAIKLGRLRNNREIRKKYQKKDVLENAENYLKEDTKFLTYFKVLCLTIWVVVVIVNEIFTI